jgi:hypothetical protein
MAYKLLGYAVWNGGKWYMRRRFGMRASRKAMVLGVVGVGAVALAARSKSRSS